MDNFSETRIRQIEKLLVDGGIETIRFEEDEEEDVSLLAAQMQIDGEECLVRFEVFPVEAEESSSIGLLAVSALSNFRVKEDGYTGAFAALNEENINSAAGHWYIDGIGRVWARYSQMFDFNREMDTAQFEETLTMFLTSFGLANRRLEEADTLERV